MRWLPTGDSATIVLIEDLGGSRYLAEVFRVADERRLHEIASGPRLVYALGYDVGLDLPEGPLALAESGRRYRPPTESCSWSRRKASGRSGLLRRSPKRSAR